ncbi:hypothetical protein D9M72_601480 [compost metagenome]
MLLCAGVMLVFLEHRWPVFLAIAGMTLGNLWIWSRPETAPLSLVDRSSARTHG